MPNRDNDEGKNSENDKEDRPVTINHDTNGSAGSNGSGNHAPSTPPQTPKISEVSMDSWEEFVLKFQDQMQVYRKLVRDFNDGDCDNKEVEDFESVILGLGKHLVKTWKGPTLDEMVKIRAKQLLNYVAAYCETHKRLQVHEQVLAFLAECVEGGNCLCCFGGNNFIRWRGGDHIKRASDAFQGTKRTIGYRHCLGGFDQVLQ